MSWMQRLYETYEQAMVNNIGNSNPMPISHTIQNTHIQLVIDGHGEFKRAKVVEKSQITLPATEKSAGRSSGEAPHALADKIQYVAGDYARFGGLKPQYFDSYQEQLHQWSESEFTLPSIKAVYAYISKKTVVADLLREGVLWAKDGVLLTQWNNPDKEQPLLFKVLPKEKGKLDQGSALISWLVESDEILYAKTWEDPELQKSWVAFDGQQGGNRSICYISGKEETLAVNHPAKLRHSGDKAKLVSANDISGLTFKGRFTDNEKSIQSSGLQAVSIGLLTTQKAHNALRWLINRQGIKNGDQVIVAWAASGKSVPAIFDENIPEFNWFSIDDDDLDATTEYTKESQLEPDLAIDIGKKYAENLRRYMSGYRTGESLTANDTVSIMAIDSATPGRMAVTYYQEKMPNDYLENITAWHIDFSWPQRVPKDRVGKNGKVMPDASWLVQSPSPYTILNAIYGNIIKSNESLKQQLYQRLLPCLADKANIPLDILRLSFNEACKTTNKKYWEWERNLGVACALFKGFYARHSDPLQLREFSMSLDTSITSRDYLYGRLLAIAEKIESTALAISKNNRPTAANRLMQRFSKNPYATWHTIYMQLDPYIRQLRSDKPKFIKDSLNEIDTIMAAFLPDEFKQDKSLEGEFLLGFHCQRLSLSNNLSEKIN